MMNQNVPQFLDVVSKEEIADSLNINLNEIVEGLPIQVVSTGLRDIIVPIKNLEMLNVIKPDFDKVAAVSQKYNSIGYHLFVLETVGEAHVHTRNFAPLYGIPEESATGTANGALIYFLKEHNLIEGDRILSLQGESMNRPSKIHCYIKKGDNGYKVKVGGNAVIVIEGILKY